MNAYGWLTIHRKTFMVGQRIVKTVKVFPHKCFAVYSSYYYYSTFDFDLLTYLKVT